MNEVIRYQIKETGLNEETSQSRGLCHWAIKCMHVDLSSD